MNNLNEGCAINQGHNPKWLLEFFLIKLFTNKGDIVLDPFLGSGTTYRVAARLNRVPVGIKIDETTPMRLESNACLDF